MDTLKHLQHVILSILKDIDVLCQNNDIEYYLAYGSTLGAIRHKGFIPWDDDIDIIMNDANYKKFIRVAREQLKKEKYYIEESLVDWPCLYSKIKLRNTVFSEIDGYDSAGENGIFVDVFKMENVPSNKILSYCQYFFAKLYLSYSLSQRSFASASLKKKILMACSFPLRVSFIRNFVKYQVERYNTKDTPYYGCFYTRYGYKGSIIPKVYYGTPRRVQFENTEMPVPENWDKYLTYIYGDYMTPPPKEKQVALHLKGMNIDFGKY